MLPLELSLQSYECLLPDFLGYIPYFHFSREPFFFPVQNIASRFDALFF
jgi:hypothetical protein